MIDDIMTALAFVAFFLTIAPLVVGPALIIYIIALQSRSCFRSDKNP